MNPQFVSSLAVAGDPSPRGPTVDIWADLPQLREALDALIACQSRHEQVSRDLQEISRELERIDAERRTWLRTLEHLLTTAGKPLGLAVTGRAVLKWLAEPFIQSTDRRKFETALYQIAEAAEEHLSSREALQYSHPTPPARNLYQQGPPPPARRPTPPPRNVYARGRPLDGIRQDPVSARARGRMPADPVFR